MLRAIYRRWVKPVLPILGSRLFPDSVRQSLLSAHIERIREAARQKTPENPMLWGRKVYSQTDEDGILEFIFEKTGGGKVFVEMGCGDGTENNTHFLLLKGWRGVWIDASESSVEFIRRQLGPDSQRLAVRRVFLNAWNCVDTVREALRAIGCTEPDLLSLDVDGNDLHLLEKILAGMKPGVLCVEYNARFPYPMAISVAYREEHAWQMDDYHGASLGAFVALAKKHGYLLVACSAAGTNAFFVRADLAGSFAAYDPADLYQPARYFLTELSSGFRPTLNYLRDALHGQSQPPEDR